jgi:uncharacterized PurR-regulated membrane protein YhhQ (DUF165 family)
MNNTAPAAPPASMPANMPLGLFVFTLLYGVMTVLAGVLAFKQVQLWPTDLAVESGIFAFLLLVVVSSTLSQLYGRRFAQRIVWWCFLPSITEKFEQLQKEFVKQSRPLVRDLSQ